MPHDLLERASTLATLSACLDEVRRSGRGQVVLVGGEAGVGKTALSRTFADEQTAATRVLWGACDALFTPRPLGPLLAVAEALGGEVEQVVTSAALPHEVAAALARELRRRGTTLFFLDDVHWADEATLDVLTLLTRRVETVPALVVATYRDDELDRTHPLRRVLGELGTRVTVRRLKLAPLSPAAVAQLAEQHGVDADQLYRKTSGNPFFVVEVLAAGTDAIPDTVRDAVLARAARLTPRARALLEAVAVIPQRAELWLLQALAPEAMASLDECLACGILNVVQHGVAFRHELARLAIEDSVVLDRRLTLHQRALAGLAEPPVGMPDLARLSHHAEAAGDVEAVLRFAPAAAARAASLGAHRQAAAQYARALHYADGLTPAERANLLELRARSCYVTDQYTEGIAALEAELKCRRAEGNQVKEGDALRRLSEFLWCPGRTAESERCAREAVALLEGMPPGPELAWAYANLADLFAGGSRGEEATTFARRALEVGEGLGDTEVAVHALLTLGVCDGSENGRRTIEESQRRAEHAGLDKEVGRGFVLLAGPAVEARRAEATHYVDAGLEYCTDRGLELFRLYMLGFRSRVLLNQGCWAEAAECAATVLRLERTSITPRLMALVVLALVRARRGDPEVWPLLQDAWMLAQRTGEVARLGPVAAARAEAAWLEGDHAAVAAAVSDALPLALERQAGWLVGELLLLQRRVGLDAPAPGCEVLEPHRLQLAGQWKEASEAWRELGSPYEAALALADADQDEPLRQALEELRHLEAAPAAALVTRRLRERGARGLPRGPRRATKANPVQLTQREFEVLALVAEGMRDAEIADRLVLSKRTVGHHVSAILNKLSVRTRAEAGIHALRLGVVDGSRRTD